MQIPPLNEAINIGKFKLKITPPFGRLLLLLAFPPALRFICLNVHWTFTLRDRFFILKKYFRSPAMQGFFKKN